MRSCNYYYNNYNALATFLSCMHFSYELLDFIGMATRESRHAIFVSYRLLKITAWSILTTDKRQFL